MGWGNRSRRWLACAVLLPLALGAGCGDDDDGGGSVASLDGYFETLSADLTELRDRSDVAFQTLNESTVVEDLQAAFAELAASLSDFRDAIADYEAPADVEALHDDAVASVEAYLALLEDVNADVQATTTVDEFVATAGNDDLQALVDEFNSYCAPLQQVADDNDVDVDLECPAS